MRLHFIKMPMKRIWNIWSVVFLLALCGCRDEAVVQMEEGSAYRNGCLSISFGHQNFGDIIFSTRSTVPTAAEDAIIDIYALIFDSAGERIYGHFFFYDNRKDNPDDLVTYEDCWWVDNQDSSESTAEAPKQTKGKINMKIPETKITAGARLYLIANLDPAVINLSESMLNVVDRESELSEMILGFNQESTYRTGNLLMIGKAEITDVNKGDDITTITIEDVEDQDDKISLKRVDAKVKVNVAIVPGLYLKEDPVLGNKYERLESFTPSSWQVINVPKKSNLLEKKVNNAVIDAEGQEFFNSEEHLFETKETQSYTLGGDALDDDRVTSLGGTNTDRTVHGFSFYMFENHQSAAKALTVGGNYHLRDKRNKNDQGEYTEGWKYAPEDATYLIIKGEITMAVNDKTAAEGKPQTLNAKVCYYIHLGDLTRDMDNYDIDRNTSYTYNINIKGVDKIQLEVIKDNQTWEWNDANEEESGAMGEVYVAQEDIYTFDAHYGQRVFTFNFDAMLKTLEAEDLTTEDKINAVKKKLTWAVYTPFGRQGSPDRLPNGLDVPTGLDYQWVEFLKNETETVDGKLKYKEENQAYPKKTDTSKELLNVIELCDYLRGEIAKELRDEKNDFDDEGNIRFTTFVNEFYYEKDPISGQNRKNLWHEFVNQPMRMMHILCSANVSKDGDSSATGSVVTIRQRSIQTVYNTTTADEGWGCETVDEIRATKNDNNERRSFGFFKTATNEQSEEELQYNTSSDNGLYNSAYLWGLLSDDGTAFKSDQSWNTYLDYNRRNDHSVTANGDEVGVVYNFMNDNYKNLRYSCLMRNRDNNRNEVIDADEVRWYLASTQQLVTLFIGDLGLAGEAQLYNIDNPTIDNYKSQVISSTRSGTYNVEMVWAEEGASISYAYYDTDIHNKSVRCVRNLGREETGYDVANRNSYPSPPVKASRNTDGTFRFDLTNLNDASKRIRVSEELIPLDEYSDMSRVYNGFETGIIGNNGTVVGNYADYENEMYQYLLDGRTYCPIGYHVPNIREAAVMVNFLNVANLGEENREPINVFWSADAQDQTGSNGFFVCSYYRFGPMGLGYDNKQRSWFFTRTIMSIGDDTGRNHYVRCVRDIDP